MQYDIFNNKSNESAKLDMFEQAYSLYFNKIYNLAYRMTGNSDAAADIAQETFTQVFSNFHKYKGYSKIYTWIYAIAKNICFRYLKDLKRKSFYSMEELIRKVSISEEEYSEQEKDQYIRQVKDGCLLGLLRCLSLNQRIAFILNVLFDIPINGIAVIINKSENSTRILVCRARKNLREFLCKNCSLYEINNHCKCENLIAFSLKQGWIEKYNPNIPPEVVESELKEFKSDIGLYKTISLRDVCDVRMKTLLAIKENKFSIFYEKKVK